MAALPRELLRDRLVRAAGGIEPGWPQTVFGTSEMRTLAVGDLDGDGDLEVAASSDVHSLARLLDDGSRNGGDS